tara:strand:+ start:14 stop:439 length:426 start_codon:yes stop_codon:yes gene_type:complete
MAILGGAGNPVGGSFTGPAEALEIVGDHAYAYSGVQGINGTESNLLSFTTGNFYFVGTLQFQYVQLQGESFQYKFYMNDTEVQGFVWDSGTTGDVQPPTTILDVIIPAYTQVRATAENVTDNATRNQVCNIAGRIYRANPE